MGKILILFFTFTFLLFTLLPKTVSATVDPISVPNNKFGIHIITPSPDESSPAASLVNTNGDWGYITILVESGDRNHGKWQEFFNDLRRRHLIPIIRLATKPVNGNWERPYEKEYEAWADFLDNLNWPTKNRYVVVYNEPNHGQEWGGAVDAKLYAETLDKTITELKSKNRNFFVLNGGFDASAPNQPPKYEDESVFLKQMNDAVPGIFDRLDGWASHSYPNPAFLGSPNAIGRGTVRTYVWELQQLRNLGVTKILPVFITETGWIHAEGLNFDFRLPSADTLSSYYKTAYGVAWDSQRIVAVTPFLLNYQETPFDHFSFKKIASSFYPFYQTIKDMAKVIGKPIQENLAKLSKGEVYSSLVTGETYSIAITFKNVGQSIWNDPAPSGTGQVVKLVPLQGGQELGIRPVEIPKETKVEPGGEYTFNISLKAPEKGTFKVKLNLFSKDEQFKSEPVEFTTQVKQPVILQIFGKLKWKDNPTGDYILSISGIVGDSSQKVILNSSGKSPEIEARYLLPDYSFEFSLEKPYYHPITIHQTVKSGVNVLDFGLLQPDIVSALLHPKQLWKLLPFSN